MRRIISTTVKCLSLVIGALYLYGIGYMYDSSFENLLLCVLLLTLHCVLGLFALPVDPARRSYKIVLYCDIFILMFATLAAFHHLASMPSYLAAAVFMAYGCWAAATDWAARPVRLDRNGD